MGCDAHCATTYTTAVRTGSSTECTRALLIEINTALRTVVRVYSSSVALGVLAAHDYMPDLGTRVDSTLVPFFVV